MLCSKGSFVDGCSFQVTHSCISWSVTFIEEQNLIQSLNRTPKGHILLECHTIHESLYKQNNVHYYLIYAKSRGYVHFTIFSICILINTTHEIYVCWFLTGFTCRSFFQSLQVFLVLFLSIFLTTISEMRNSFTLLQLQPYHFMPSGFLHPITAMYELSYGETEMKQGILNSYFCNPYCGWKYVFHNLRMANKRYWSTPKPLSPAVCKQNILILSVSFIQLHSVHNVHFSCCV